MTEKIGPGVAAGPEKNSVVGSLSDNTATLAYASLDRTAYVLAELRCAVLRARLWQADIEAVGVALKAGWIDSEQALEALADCDALHLVGGVREEGSA